MIGSTQRILTKLDDYLHKNDYDGAERHLRYWLSEVEASDDVHTRLTLYNELMGLYRKLGREQDALACVEAALELMDRWSLGEQVGGATTLLNCATVYKAFGKAKDALPLFERARTVYEGELEPTDSRLGGLYNNMGLALVDLGRFHEAKELYRAAISIMEQTENGALEVAITYLNLASAAEQELGAVDADATVQCYLDKAQALLDGHGNKDGYYAFVCEKCASVFGYYGHFLYQKDLEERARRIYAHA